MYHFNSNNIISGDTFICLPGAEGYIDDALEKGAVEIKKMTRAEMAQLANEVYDAPSKKLTTIGVTGTNGKTTVCHLIASVIRQAGYSPRVLGTLNGELTTPESLDIQRLMATHLAEGGTHFVMEVSSIGIDQHRVDCIDFDLKILTNITQDHLDYHGSFETYKKTKLSYMNEGDGAAIFPENYNDLVLEGEHSLLGKFNDKNIKAAVLALQTLGISPGCIWDTLSTVTPPPGRFEPIIEGQPFAVIVDYAHTPDGLENVLVTAKEMATDQKGRLLCLFGCGGDRDRGKRPKMGRIAEQYSDYFIITEDNPRSEPSETINNDILEGVSEHCQSYQVIPDRAEAIDTIIRYCKQNDVVVLAGKGHETDQVLSTGTLPFDDRKQARLVLRTLYGN